ncbi:MAG: ABC transporter permease subunit, partial [Pirellulales bacterium]|nr:ABC transporter permease subunit [Pirellulales bacterium]
MSVAWLMVTGTQLVRDVGDLARFGVMVFQILGPLQLVVVVFFSALLAASAVAQEKDRKTLELLLLTNLSNAELVLGKLMASLLSVLVLTAAAVPVFMFLALLGGVSFAQVGRLFAVTLASVLVGGSLGSTLALWREKTFQALAMTVMAIVLWIALWEAVALGAFGRGWGGLPCAAWAASASPWRAALETLLPFTHAEPALGWIGTPVNLFLLVALAGTVLLNGVAIVRVRSWNTTRETRRIEGDQRAQSVQEHLEGDSPLFADAKIGTVPAKPVPAEPVVARQVWDNPVLWREIRTWAYGRKILLVRLAYLILFALAAGGVWWMLETGGLDRAHGAMALLPLFLLSLFLLNAQAVTALTSERDARALDLLLVTDLSPKEIVFGKLGGVLFNTKEMILLPMALCIYLWWRGAIGLENLLFLLGGLVVLDVFVAVLGIHAGMHYFNSRSAIATSLGTLFFLFVGVATCMRMMVAFSG